MYPPLTFVKNKWIYWRHGFEASDDGTTTNAIRRVNDKMFKCFDKSVSTSDSSQNNLRRKTCLIIVTDVNMTSKRAFLQKVKVLLASTTENGVLLE